MNTIIIVLCLILLPVYHTILSSVYLYGHCSYSHKFPGCFHHEILILTTSTSWLYRTVIMRGNAAEPTKRGSYHQWIKIQFHVCYGVFCVSVALGTPCTFIFRKICKGSPSNFILGYYYIGVQIGSTHSYFSDFRSNAFCQTYMINLLFAEALHEIRHAQMHQEPGDLTKELWTSQGDISDSHQLKSE